MPVSAGAGLSDSVTFLPECRPIPAHEIERRSVRCAFIRVSGRGIGVLSWIAIVVPAGPFDYTPKILPDLPLIARVHSGEVEQWRKISTLANEKKELDRRSSLPQGLLQSVQSAHFDAA